MTASSTANLTRPSTVGAILDQLDLRPAKTMGQNFLVDANILNIILNTAEINSTDEILEIGTGLGVLTLPLAKKARRIVTVEKDRRLREYLRAQLRPLSNVELICGDALTLDLKSLLASGINKVVSNLPYSVGSAILVNLLKCEPQPAQMIVTIQLEVAERLTAPAGGKAYGLLSVWSQLTFDTAIRRIIKPTCFLPAPAVRSALIRMTRRERPLVDLRNRNFFFDLTKFAFSQRRKQLQTLFRAAPAEWRLSASGLETVYGELGIEGRARPEELSAGQWGRLANALCAQRGA